MSYNKIIMILLCLAFISYSCNKTIEKNEYYSNGKLKTKLEYIDIFKNGQLKTYDSLGNLLSEIKINKGEPNGKYKVFYKNGNLKEVGTFQNGDIVGWRINYDSTGLVISKKEYLWLKDMQYLNQIKIYNIDGTINTNQSLFYKIYKLENSIKIKIFPAKGYDKTRLVIGCFPEGYGNMDNVIFNETTNNFEYIIPNFILKKMTDCTEIIIDNYKEIIENKQIMWETRRIYVVLDI